jgi:gamma-glutamylcyclotransferase
VASLDRSEGAPIIYQKEIHSVQLKTGKGETIDALIYIDNNSISFAGKPKKEYILRINMALQDGIENGIPQPYVDKYIRPYIPPFKFTVKI